MGKHPALDLETAAVPPRTVAPPPAQPWHSWLVPLFTVANVSLFVLTMYLNDCPRNEPVGLGGKMKEKSSCLFVRSLGRFAFQPLDENSFLGPSSTTLDFMGALDWKKVCAALLTLMFIITINLAVGIDPHIDNSAHIGGFISGFLLGFVLLIRPQFGWISRRYIPPGYDMGHVKPKYKMYQYILWVIAFIFLMMGYVGGLIKLYSAHPLDN
ncbi:hypothetical protein AMTR_s00104p00044730 [Amborella trichopoda]|uniref:RHOMBOID-like protein n=1 Tax=Amborella trichopoda TaxID=13333 RepID=W1P061_AMBTC|nr:hypothetical protein AMTR_s00104p00044730 [Amborella trichopoda]